MSVRDIVDAAGAVASKRPNSSFHTYLRVFYHSQAFSYFFYMQCFVYVCEKSQDALAADTWQLLLTGKAFEKLLSDVAGGSETKDESFVNPYGREMALLSPANTWPRVFANSAKSSKDHNEVILASFCS